MEKIVLNKLTKLAFPFGESGFCELSEQKTREVDNVNLK